MNTRLRRKLSATFAALVAALSLASTAGAQNQQLPPLIDREIFFGDPEITGAQLSPDGRYVSFLKSNAGQINIWVKQRAQPFSAAIPLTADSTRPITGYFWSRDSKYVLYVHDKGGDEDFHVFAVDPAQARRGKLPPARDLTPGAKVTAMVVSRPKPTPNVILVALNDRDQTMHDVYRVDLATGKRELIFKNEVGLAGYNADHNGNLRIGVKTGESGTEVYRIEDGTPKLLFTMTCDVFQGCTPIQFHKDGRRLYVSNANADENFTHLALYDLETGKWEKVEEDPERQVDFGGAEFSYNGDLLATYYVGDRVRMYPKDPQFAKDVETVRKAVVDGDISFGSSTADDRLHIVSVTSDVDPNVTYLYDRQTGKVELLYRPRPKLPLEHLAPMQPVRYTARDGLEIPAYLTLPKGVAPRNLPTIVLPHGGPWARDMWGYNGFAQFLANRGYAVLQPNFRGSTGFGRRFLDAGNMEWGTGAMQHDLSDAVQWLIEKGYADPKRIGIMGGSYGGYATLAGVAFTPDLYAVGVSIVGPSSIPTLLASVPPYWKPVKQLFDTRLGDPSNPQHMERLKAQSPLYKASDIKVPLLVIQGQNDPRVNKAESDQIVIALRDLGRSPAYIVAPDEGHGFARRENRIAMFAAIEKFLAQHLGGRYQPDMPEEIQNRLAVLTVNVDTLKLKPATSAAGGPAKFDGAKLRAGTWNYTQKVEAAGRTIDATTTMTISQATEAGQTRWLVVEESKTPMGTVSDSVWLDAQTLAPARRIIHQGPATVSMTLTADSITGAIKAGPQEMPIRVQAAAPVFMSGGALQVALSTLPLANGYTASYRLFDVMAAGVKEHQLTVAGTEKVTVPAGTFDAIKVSAAPADGSAGTSTYWVESAAPHRVVRMEAELPPQMGGGKVVSELAK